MQKHAIDACQRMQNIGWMLKHANARQGEKMGGKCTLDICPTGLKLLKMLRTKPAKIGARCMPKHTKQWLDAKTCTTHGKNMQEHV